MNERPGGTSGAVGPTQVGGPAAIAAAMRQLDHYARSIVKLALAQDVIKGANVADGVARWHDHVTRMLHSVALEHGSDAMMVAAEYASAALEAGVLYAGDELDLFLRDVASAARETARDLTKASPIS